MVPPWGPMVRRPDRSGQPRMRPRSARHRRWVSAVIALAMASRMLLPLRDGVMVAADGHLVPVCTANGLRLVPVGETPPKAPLPHAGDQAACVHGLSAMSCLQEFQRPACLSADPVRESPGFGLPARIILSLDIRERRARDPPRPFLASHHDAVVRALSLSRHSRIFRAPCPWLPRPHPCGGPSCRSGPPRRIGFPTRCR